MKTFIFHSNDGEPEYLISRQQAIDLIKRYKSNPEDIVDKLDVTHASIDVKIGTIRANINKE